ncbi:nuclear transport factor 2 family protein [Pseudomonas arsenicoxydans]|uniref:Nuclear transport factor 2 family protein n=1 Tax=Pseudomonas arsenicoxydans TaxID=702115 RepID=A0A4P6G1U0_9PSED|nr:nuclear transport factor 2 family protein [Pseudomonas arsenicoxydans]QAY84016.1 nuclear transport factor 2 family protein [Pseudomonas arsenicoxydans]
MQNYLEDRLQINDLITGWIHRDLGQWDQLANLAHPDGTIEVTWFEGPFAEFVEGSKRMGKSNLRTKHLIGTPVVTINGNKAIVETNAVIIGENVQLDLGCSVHNRFYDLVEKRQGLWKLVKRQSIYDMGGFTFPQGLVEIDGETVARYPREYAPLAYLLEKSGFPLDRVFATRGSELEGAMRAEACAWLAD